MRFLHLNSFADYRACLKRKDRWGIPSAGMRTLDTDEMRRDGESAALAGRTLQLKEKGN